MKLEVHSAQDQVQAAESQARLVILSNSVLAARRYWNPIPATMQDGGLRSDSLSPLAFRQLGSDSGPAAPAAIR